MSSRSKIETAALFISAYSVIWYQQSIVGRFSFTILGFAVICVIFLIRLAKGRATISKFTLGICLMPLVSAMLSIVPALGEPGYYITDIVGSLVYYFVFWITILAVASLMKIEELRDALLTGITFAGVFAACFGLIQLVQWVSNTNVIYLFPTNPTFHGMGVLSLLERDYLRITGPLAEPSEYALFLTLVLFTEIESSRKNSVRIVLYVSCILLTLSLAAYLGLLVGGLSLIVRQMRRRGCNPKKVQKGARRLILVVITFVLILVVFFIVSQELRERFSLLIQVLVRRINFFDDPSVRFRQASIAEGFRLWRDGDVFALCFGYGSGNYSLLGTIDVSSKSMITKILMEEGIVGLTLNIAFWILLLRKVLHKKMIFVSVLSICFVSWATNDVFVMVTYYLFMGILIGSVAVMDNAEASLK